MSLERWKHPVPDRHEFRYSQSQAEWAIAERLEELLTILDVLTITVKRTGEQHP